MCTTLFLLRTGAPDVLIALQRSTMLIALQCSGQKAGWGWGRGALNEIPRRECDRRRHNGDMTPTNFLQCHHCQHRPHYHHQCHSEDGHGNHAQQVHFRPMSETVLGHQEIIYLPWFSYFKEQLRLFAISGLLWVSWWRSKQVGRDTFTVQIAQ